MAPKAAEYKTESKKVKKSQENINRCGCCCSLVAPSRILARPRIFLDAAVWLW